jgi:Dolichyl-phosphate-mannose-protein mannosyltransferase
MGNDPNHIEMKPEQGIRLIEPFIIRLILLFALLQLLVSLLTYGFSLTFDEAIWQYIGRNWFRHGLTPYTGGVDNKSPLIFAIYGLSDKLFGVNYWFPRLLGTICQSFGLYYVYRIAVWIDGRQTGRLAVLLYGLSLLWRSTGGKYVSYTETYEVTLLIIAFYLFLTARLPKDFFICGMVSALAGGFRLSAFFGIMALLLYSFNKNKLTSTILLAGIICGILILGGIAFSTGIKMTDLYLYGFTDNFGAGSATDHTLLWRFENFSDKFFYSEILLFYPPVIAYFFIKKGIDFLGLWLICSFIGINVVGIYDRAHLKEILPVLCLMSAISINYLIEFHRISCKRTVLIIWIVFFPKLLEPLICLKNLLIGTRNDPKKYCQFPYPEPDESSLKKLGQWVKANTNDQEKVLVAGYGAIVQAYSERIAPGIYFNLTQTEMAKKRFYRDLSTNEPGMILIPVYAGYAERIDRSLQIFIDELVLRDYYFSACMNGYRIYQNKKIPRGE